MVANSTATSLTGLLKNSPSCNSTANENDFLISPDTTNLDERAAATMLSQTQPDSSKSPHCVLDQSSSHSCSNRTCLRCQATELEPLCLAQTECATYTFPSDLKVGHVNHVYMPESPLSPISSTGQEVYDTMNQANSAKQFYNQNNNNHIKGRSTAMSNTGGSSSGAQRLRHNTVTSATNVLGSTDSKQYLFRSTQVHFDNCQDEETPYHEVQYFSDQDIPRNAPYEDDGSDLDEDPNLRPCDSGERHYSDSQPYQKLAGRYRKRGTTRSPQQHTASFPGSVAAKHKRSLQNHASRDALMVTSSGGQKYMHPSHSPRNPSTSECSRGVSDAQRLYSIPQDFQRAHRPTHLVDPKHQQQTTQHSASDQDDEQPRGSIDLFLSGSNSLPSSPAEMGVSTAAAMFIPAMATNLLPFPVPIQSSVVFTHKPVTKQQARQLAGDPESGVGSDRSTGDQAAIAPRKKKTSLVALVRGRRSDKGKSKDLAGGTHNRSLSLNRSSGSSRGKVVTLKHQRSKEI
ncbi:hypothetical protein EGW08_018164 [Elysia chlorotica]|uniref:Uncharacterized protein n=1 Tax=Elysia chlorotica TaxID=188477 RepID=A0A433SXP4_ELYCH|nr:hypothetical protein EGW08_018164 [Elysia chlorotica]